MKVTDAARVLVVDDDLGLLRLVQKALQREGFATAGASSGAQALEWLAANSADLLLLDLKLEDTDGRELIRKLKAAGHDTPFLVITGQGDERMAVEMMKSGALDYLVKDVQFLELVPTVVRRAVEKIETDRRLVAAQRALEESQRQLMEISEREQRRFGAELHDGLGQQLTAIELMCQSMRQDLPPKREDLHKDLAQICQFLREAISQTRSLARGLAPVDLAEGGLATALDQLANRMSKGGRVQCVFASGKTVSIEDSVTAAHLFRIAQEAVNNAVRHSRGTEVVITLREDEKALRLQVSDNGKGIEKSSRDQGIGLEVMKHRASAIGADLEVSSTPEGVTITCAVPHRKK